jgi:hypothetical protein
LQSRTKAGKDTFALPHSIPLQCCEATVYFYPFIMLLFAGCLSAFMNRGDFSYYLVLSVGLIVFISFQDVFFDRLLRLSREHEQSNFNKASAINKSKYLSLLLCFCSLFVELLILAADHNGLISALP